MIQIKNIIIYSLSFLIMSYMIYDAIKVSSRMKVDDKNGK